MSRIRPVIQRRPAEGPAIDAPGFLSPFGHRHSLLGHPIPARELGLPHGRLTGPQTRTPTGLPRSTRTSCDRAGSPLHPEHGGAHPGWDSPSPGTCRFPATSPYTLLQHPTLQGCCLRGINRGSRNSPVRSSPRLWPPDGTGALGLLPRAPDPAGSSPTTHVRVGTGDRARAWNYALDISRTSNPLAHSKRATSCSRQAIRVGLRPVLLILDHNDVFGDQPRPDRTPLCQRLVRRSPSRNQ
jgi:hypothetical protein